MFLKVSLNLFERCFIVEHYFKTSLCANYSKQWGYMSTNLTPTTLTSTTLTPTTPTLTTFTKTTHKQSLHQHLTKTTHQQPVNNPLTTLTPSRSYRVFVSQYTPYQILEHVSWNKCRHLLSKQEHRSHFEHLMQTECSKVN